MMQAPQSCSPSDEGMSMYAKARVCIICAFACATLGWAHQSNIEHVQLDPAHRIEDEQARQMLRDALIKESTRGRVLVDAPPPKPTVGTSRGVSRKAYTIRAEKVSKHSPVTLRRALEDLDSIKGERRDRMEARGEDVSDMNAFGHTTLKGALEDFSEVEQHRRKRHVCGRRMRSNRIHIKH